MKCRTCWWNLLTSTDLWGIKPHFRFQPTGFISIHPSNIAQLVQIWHHQPLRWTWFHLPREKPNSYRLLPSQLPMPAGGFLGLWEQPKSKANLAQTLLLVEDGDQWRAHTQGAEIFKPAGSSSQRCRAAEPTALGTVQNKPRALRTASLTAAQGIVPAAQQAALPGRRQSSLRGRHSPHLG